MRISEFIVRESISVRLQADDKSSAIRQLVTNIKTAGYFPGNQVDDVVNAVFRREKLGSTGIGRGVAIPHAKYENLDRLVGTVAIANKGVPFDSVDKEPVDILVMLISPRDRTAEHLLALQRISSWLIDDSVIAELKKAQSADEVWNLIVKHDLGMAG
jgi:PTS system fructose-specific IIA component/PTS system nitrogen regulatory IIA component